MCNLSDAKYWSGLNDVEDSSISGHSSKNISVTENWFATSIATSYVKGNYRMITYADNLNVSSKTLIQYNNVI